MASGAQARYVNAHDVFKTNLWGQLLQLLIGVKTFHGSEYAIRATQMTSYLDEARQICKGPRNNHIEDAGRMPFFSALHDYLHVLELKFRHGLP